jgi:branched-chain amino acid transport system ATP-binding protein
VLQVTNLQCTYNNVIHALGGVTITVNKGEIVGLLGPNGAGKTTSLRCITGEIGSLNGRITEGEILYNDRKLGSLLPFEVTRMGISLVPEDRQLFIDMTVEENLTMGAYIIDDRALIRDAYEKVFTYFPVLKDLRRRLTGYLSGGEQQMLAIARALMSNPQLLLLDEPSTGLAPKIVSSIFEIIKKIRDENGMSILLVEQNASMTLKISDSCIIMENGRTVLQGTPDQLRADARIKNIYFGISEETSPGPSG